MQAKNLNIIRFGMWCLVVMLVFLVLYLGKGLIVPLVLAIFIFYLINILADGIARVPLGKFRLPRAAAVIVAILIIAFLFNQLFSLITSNLSELGRKWPAYQERLQGKLNDAYDRWEKFMHQVQTFQPAQQPEEAPEPGSTRPNLVEAPDMRQITEPRFDPALELASPRAPPETGLRPSFESRPPQISDIFAEVRVTEILTRAVQALTDTIGFTGLMLIYLMFLFIEQRSFNQKLHAMMDGSPNRARQTVQVLRQIDQDIRKYLGVKTFTSLVTGIISYVVMRAVGLSFAEFWAVLIFLLNFIPSIGSIIATIFPTILALVDGNSLWPFIIVGGGITALQFAIGNIIEPRLMGNTLNLSPLIILLSLALWGSIWGVAGAVLCVPITVICTIVCSYFPTTRPIAILLSKNGQLKNLQDEESASAAAEAADLSSDESPGQPHDEGELGENSGNRHPVPDAS